MELAFEIRRAIPEDSTEIFNLIQLLAEYERAPNQVVNSPENIRFHGFGENPIFYAWVATRQKRMDDGKQNDLLGMAICYIRYSTWKGPVLYLEDLVVKDEYRKLGVGSALLDACLDFAKEKKHTRMTWQVLEWNEPAIKFYKKHGVTFDAEWLNCTIEL